MSGHLPYEGDELLSRMAEGDEEAFRIIFDRYFRRLCFFSDSFIENQEDAKDIVQDVLYQIWSRRQHFTAEASLRSFLYIATRNASLNYLKAAHRRTARRLEMERMLEHEPDLMETSVAREELLHKVLLELDAVPEKYASVLKMLFFQGLDYKEVAAKLAMPVATVRKQKERGLKSLQAALLRKKLLPLFVFYLFFQKIL